ncbi:hypothetical protein BDN72DRAFT_844338 [Pluteus cervinus]|uniref:Uncharacterized protein n=1 Tax=Pluteus cervinus TaxID=181527 RepID=A0ACD3AL45_9AGAR|nr:hypothetical protein BDN72DRAFT_844338 [Pluteus cervinus]
MKIRRRTTGRGYCSSITSCLKFPGYHGQRLVLAGIIKQPRRGGFDIQISTCAVKTPR